MQSFTFTAAPFGAFGSVGIARIGEIAKDATICNAAW